MRMLEVKLSEEVSAEKIREVLRSIRFTEFSIEGVKYILRNKMDKVAKELIRALRIAPSEHMTGRETFQLWEIPKKIK